MFPHFIIMMTSAPVLLLLPYFAIGLFAHDVEFVSVMEGDSVTLHANLINSRVDLEWRSETLLIASNIDFGEFSIPIELDRSFRERLQVDEQTGDLRIRNIRTSDSAVYSIWIQGDLLRRFNVTCLHNLRFDEMTIVSVSEGDSVVLHNDITEIQTEDEIIWKFKKEYVIARIIKNKQISTYDDEADGIFKGKLLLNDQNGNLIITNIRSETSGIYELDVKKKYHTLHSSFNVTIRDQENRVNVKEGTTVILESGVELDDDDLAKWRFEKFVIAEINQTAHSYNVLTGRFGDRLKVDHETGSLTIDNIRNTDCGVYHLDIMGRRHVIFKIFILSVCCHEDLRLTFIVLMCAVPLVAFGLVIGMFLYYRRKNRRPVL